jgi:hypothetical protein
MDLEAALIHPVFDENPPQAASRKPQAASRKPQGRDIDSRTLRSTPESGERAGYDGGNVRRALRSIWPSIRRYVGPSAGA